MSRDNSETRNRILTATWELLESQQSQQTRMTDIAKRAGISRQAVYLHFATRTELLIATARYLDIVNKVDERLIASRTATSGRKRMAAFIKAWGNYIPEIYAMAKAFWAMQGDKAAEAAWDDRMQAVRQGCEAAVKRLHQDGHLTEGLSQKMATDILWTLLSVRNWEQLTQNCNWSQSTYIHMIQSQAEAILCSNKSR